MLRVEVRRFALRVALFALPLALIVGALDVGLWRMGEAYPATWVVDAQQSNPGVIYLRGLMDQQFGGFKFQALQRLHPRVVCVGTSRVMQITAAMFSPHERFYNFGGGVQSAADLHAFVQRLPDDTLPQVILIGIDPWWFNPNVPDTEFFSAQVHSATTLFAITDWRGQLSAIRSLLRHPELLKATLRGGRYPANLGLSARLKGEGFLGDGSYRYATEPAAGWYFIDRENPPVYKRIESGTMQFVPASAISPERLASFRSSIETLRKRGVLVIGFLPTMSSQALELLEHDPRHAGLWRAYRTQLATIFDELEQPFVDATSPASIGVDDRYMLDGMHGMQTLQLHLLQRLLADARVDAALPGTREVVERALRDPRTDFWTPYLAVP